MRVAQPFNWQQAVALCTLWVFVVVECVIVWGRVMMKKSVGGGFGVDHDGDDDSAADNVFAAAAVGFDVNVSAATAAVAAAAAAVAAADDAAAATHRLMRCRLWSRRGNAFRFEGSTAGCWGWG